MTNKTYSLSLFFPCYNDAGTIGSLVAAADVVASEYTPDYEIVVVNDGSQDQSQTSLKDLQKIFPKLKVITHEQNRGYGAALRTGFSNCTKELIFYTDGDAQYDVYDLRHLLPIMQEGVDIVNGYKISRNDPWYRIVVGGIYLWSMRFFFGFRVRDIDCDFRLMRRSALESIQLKHTSGVICLEMVKKLELAGFRFADYPVSHYHRRYGKSQFFKIGRLTRTFIQIMILWWQLVVRKESPRDIAHRVAADSENPTLHSQETLNAGSRKS